MDARYFRYLFENTSNGIIQSGSVLDSKRQQRNFYLYLAGVGREKIRLSDMPSCIEADVRKGESIFLIVLADYTVSYMKYLIKILQAHCVENVVLPYIPALRRFSMAVWLSEHGEKDSEFYLFLERPYEYLKTAGVKNVYYVYGNGKPIENLEKLTSGAFFEPADEEDLKLAEMFEGRRVPLVKAGYLVENQWLFYFGSYGTDLKTVMQLIRRYCTQEEYYMIMRNHNGRQMRRLLYAYGKNFGSIPPATVTMFHGPIHDSPAKIDSLLSTKAFTSEKRCHVGTPCLEETCALKCLYHNDYDMIKKHKSKNVTESRFGMLLLGNVNLSTEYQKVMCRYRIIQNKVRGISIPNGGALENWQEQILDDFMGDDIKYWVCSIEKDTSADILKSILMKNAFYRLIHVDAKYGYCFSGYIVPAVEDCDFMEEK